MKVIATGFKRQRIIIDNVDPTTAGMTAFVLNELEAKKFLNHECLPGGWFYHPEADEYEVKHGS